MRKTPPGASTGAVCNPISRCGDIMKLTTVVYSGHILAPARAIGEVFLGFVFHMASKGAQRATQGLQKGTPGGDFRR